MKHIIINKKRRYIGSTTSGEIARYYVVIIPPAATGNVHVRFDKKITGPFFDPSLRWNRIKNGVSKYQNLTLCLTYAVLNLMYWNTKLVKSNGRS
jgi:hypothetical protein